LKCLFTSPKFRFWAYGPLNVIGHHRDPKSTYLARKSLTWRFWWSNGAICAQDERIKKERNKKDGYRQRNVHQFLQSHFGLPWVRRWDNRGKCHMDEKRTQCSSKASQHLPMYNLQPFPSNSTRTFKSSTH